MLLTVTSLLERPDLELHVLAGRDGLDREVRWAHVIELANPVPWLRGGELVLTIGIGVPGDEDGQRAYVRGLAERGCAGLGFAQGEIMDELPAPVLEEADAQELPVLAAFGNTPFMAIIEAVANWHADQRSRHERMALGAQDAMARAALRTGYEGVLRELARGTGGDVVLLGSSGQVRAAVPSEPNEWHERVRAAVQRRPRGAMGLTDEVGDIHVQSVGVSGAPSGWLAVRCPRPEPAHVRLLANHAAALAGVGIDRVRAARAEAHRYRAAIFSAALDAGNDGGRGGWDEVERTCPLPTSPFEILLIRSVEPGAPRSDSAHMVLPVLDALAEVLDQAMTERVIVCPRESGVLVVLPGRDESVGRHVCDHLRTVKRYRVAAGAARARGRAELPAAVTRACNTTVESGYRNADDIGAWPLLREAMEPDAVEQFTSTVLDRVDDGGTDRSGTPSQVACLRAFLDSGANLEAAARSLGIHRNTLRSRLRSAQRLSGRSLDDPRSRLELWLAVTLASERTR